MRLLIVGTGYVGLVAAACFAEMGHSVLSLDIDEEKIEALKRGKIPIYEPGLEELVRRNVESDRLFFTTDYSEGVNFAEVIFLTVATPSLSDGNADLSSLKSAAMTIANLMDKPLIIVNKSTAPPPKLQNSYENGLKPSWHRGARLLILRWLSIQNF